MTNHVHLLMTPQRSTGISALMKPLGQRYLQYVNRVYRRSGSLWEGRFRSSMVDAENCLLACQRHIELNPVRAGMVEHPADYLWLSYRNQGQSQASDIVQSHPLYRALGGEPEPPPSDLPGAVSTTTRPGVVDEIHQAANAGFALGNEKFREEVSLALGRRSAPGQPGRPKKRSINDVAQSALHLA
ncbi:transposase [Hydrocarboniphaga sp.]|uniref:transposase n=1 Tax=Hydrocarboniphaga sp. TaxID=2033016 RepID=UPI003D117C12